MLSLQSEKLFSFIANKTWILSAPFLTNQTYIHCYCNAFFLYLIGRNPEKDSDYTELWIKFIHHVVKIFSRYNRTYTQCKLNFVGKVLLKENFVEWENKWGETCYWRKSNINVSRYFLKLFLFYSASIRRSMIRTWNVCGQSNPMKIFVCLLCLIVTNSTVLRNSEWKKPIEIEFIYYVSGNTPKFRIQLGHETIIDGLFEEGGIVGLLECFS